MKSVSVVQAGDRSRVVLNLKQATPYTASLQGKSLLVVLNAVTKTALAEAPKTNFAENQNRDTLPIKNLDFRRGDEGVGSIVVTLPNNQVGVDIRPARTDAGRRIHEVDLAGGAQAASGRG